MKGKLPYIILGIAVVLIVAFILVNRQVLSWG